MPFAQLGTSFAASLALRPVFVFLSMYGPGHRPRKATIAESTPLNRVSGASLTPPNDPLSSRGRGADGTLRRGVTRPRSAATAGSALHRCLDHSQTGMLPCSRQCASILVAASSVNKSVQLMMDTASKSETNRWAFSSVIGPC